MYMQYCAVCAHACTSTWSKSLNTPPTPTSAHVPHAYATDNQPLLCITYAMRGACTITVMHTGGFFLQLEFYVHATRDASVLSDAALSSSDGVELREVDYKVYSAVHVHGHLIDGHMQAATPTPTAGRGSGGSSGVHVSGIHAGSSVQHAATLILSPASSAPAGASGASGVAAAANTGAAGAGAAGVGAQSSSAAAGPHPCPQTPSHPPASILQLPDPTPSGSAATAAPRSASAPRQRSPGSPLPESLAEYARRLLVERGGRALLGRGTWVYWYGAPRVGTTFLGRWYRAVVVKVDLRRGVIKVGWGRLTALLMISLRHGFPPLHDLPRTAPHCCPALPCRCTPHAAPCAPSMRRSRTPRMSHRAWSCWAHASCTGAKRWAGYMVHGAVAQLILAYPDCGTTQLAWPRSPS